MAQASTRSFKEMIGDRKVLLGLSLLTLTVGILIWSFLRTPGTPAPVVGGPQTGLNGKIPMAPSDSTNKTDKLALVASAPAGPGERSLNMMDLEDRTTNQNPASRRGPDLLSSPGGPGMPAGPTSGGAASSGSIPMQSTVPASIDPYMYKKRYKPTSDPVLREMERSVYAPDGETNRSRPGKYAGSGNDGEEMDPERGNAAAAVAKQKRLATLLEEYKRDKEARLQNEGDKSKVSKVAPNPVVGSLNGSDPARNNGFYGLYSDEARSQQAKTLDEEVGAIRAMIYQDQDVVQSGRVKLRLLDPCLVRGVTIPANTLIYGTGSFSAERVTIAITGIQYQDRLYPVKLTVYDMDGMAGVYVPNIMGIADAKQALGQSASGLNLTTYGAASAINPLAVASASAAQAGVNGVRSFVQRKATAQKARLKGNYYVLLRSPNTAG